VLVIIIGGGITGIVYAKIRHFNPQIILENIRLVHEVVIQKWEYNLIPEDIVEKGVQKLARTIPGLLSATGNVMANVVLMVFLLYFMLQGGKEFEQGVESFLPISQESIQLLKIETNNMIISNAIGVPAIMGLQGALAALAYWFTGAGDPIVWGLLTGFAGLIPVVGTGLIWLPLSINLFIGGNIWQGIVLFTWGICVISFVDNVFRMMFLKRYANTHPLIPLLGVILGINLLGFWGIIFGPLVISGFLLLVKIFHREFLTQ
jgi:predicted PurR-regulated permease PerM